MQSIERSLLVWILGALTVGAALVAAAAYLVTLDEMDEVFNADLRNVARAVAIFHQAAPRGDAAAPPADPAEETEIVTRVWTRDGRLLFASDAQAALPFTDREGWSRQRAGTVEWVVYTRVDPKTIVQAAQRVSARREMAGESASKIFPPLLGLMALIGGLAVFALRRGMRPLDGAARDVASRSAASLEPIATAGVPREIRPLVLAINGLMSRLSAALAMQRRFLADAAHELRTPVTALRLQLQLLERSRDEASRRGALAALESGIERTQRLIEQLLQVARSEPDAEAIGEATVDLHELARGAVAAFSAKAEQRGLDLGLRGDAGITVRGDATRLAILLDNLIENALRYTPEGGVVDVEAVRLDGRPALRVIDNGPGIAPEEREQMFDRFRRGEEAQTLARDTGGSGLGLAIVRAIAERHRASVSLLTAPSGRGLEVRVLFPRAR